MKAPPVKRIDTYPADGATHRPKPPAPSALTSLVSSGLAIALIAVAAYGINLAGQYAEARGVSLKNALLTEIALAGFIAFVAGCVWIQSQTARILASWLCLAMVARALWSAWLLVKLLYPSL